MSKLDKVERYQWVKPGDTGCQRKLPVADLRIDPHYQRPPVSQNNTLALARAFNWVAFGSIVVMERKNGNKYVVDGQQRLLAAKHRGDINQVPCVLFASDGREHEARAFIALNVRRVKVSAVAKFRASMRAGIQPEKEIADWLYSVGLAVTKDGKALDGVCFPAHLIRSWKVNAAATMQAIIIQREVNGAEALHSACHNGLFWLINNGIAVGEHVEKLKVLGGRSGMLRAIKAVEIETNMRASMRLGGIGILRLINYRRRRKIPVPGNA